MLLSLYRWFTIKPKERCIHSKQLADPRLLYFRNGRFSNIQHSTIPTFVYDRYALYALHEFTDSVPAVVATTGLKAVSSQLQQLKRNRGYQKMMTRILRIRRFNPLSALIPTPCFDLKIDGGILDIPVTYVIDCNIVI